MFSCHIGLSSDVLAMLHQFLASLVDPNLGNTPSSESRHTTYVDQTCQEHHV